MHRHEPTSRTPQPQLQKQLLQTSPPLPTSKSVHSQCRIYDPSSRYVCNGHAHQLSNLLDDGASAAQFHASAYFVGDSLSLQHMHAFACSLLADVPTRNLTEELARHSTHGIETQCFRRRDGRPGRVCHFKAGELVTEPSAAEACKGLANASGLLGPGDLVVANEGVWRRAFGYSSNQSLVWGKEFELSRVREFSARVARSVEAAGATLLWRETAAQHFGRTPTGQYKPGCKDGCKPGCPRDGSYKAGCNPHCKSCGECGAIRNAQPLRSLNAEISQMMAALHVRVLPVFERSVGMWDEHVARRSAEMVERNILDCTHFCEPVRLFGELQPLLLEVAANSSTTTTAQIQREVQLYGTRWAAQDVG